MQLSKIIIGTLAVNLIVVGFFFYIASGANTYTSISSTGYNNESFIKIGEVYKSINSTIQESESELNNTKSDSITDFLGYFFNKGYQAVKITLQVISSEYTLVDASVTNLPLGQFGAVVKSILIIMILVVFSVGLLLAFIIKSGRE
jgi:hypothetical protein